jgi:hypothetical protein
VGDGEGAGVKLTRDHFAVSEAITYYEFTLETAVAQGL